MKRSTVPRLLKGRVLRGWNVHHRSSVFTQRVDLGELAGRRLPATGVLFERALLEAIIAVERLVAGSMGRLDTLDFATIIRDPASRREVDLVWTCHSGSVARTAARVGFVGLLELIPAGLLPGRDDSSEDFAALLRRLEQRAGRRPWSKTTAALALEAARRGVPYEILAGEYVRLGDGAKQRVVSASSPEFTTKSEARAALELIFPTGASASVPIALILGNRGTGSLAKDLDGLLRASGRLVGLATRKLTTIAGKPVGRMSPGRGGGARFLLGDPRVEMLVCAVSPGIVVERGLRVDRTAVTAILDLKVGEDPDTCRRAIDVAVSAATGAIVLDAGAPSSARLLGELGPQRVVLLSSRGRGRAIRHHLSSGGTAVVLTRTGSAESIELLRSSGTVASVSVSLLRSRSGAVGKRRIREAMFTTALAFGLGLSGVEILAAFETGRFLRR